jgi:hypothetical protein
MKHYHEPFRRALQPASEMSYDVGVYGPSKNPEGFATAVLRYLGRGD